MTSTTSNWTINVSDIRTVKVSNVSLSASEQDIKEFLSFSGDILHVEMRRENESSQAAFVTFKDSHGADTATLLSGSTVSDRHITITRMEDYRPPHISDRHSEGSGKGAVRKAEEVVSTVLAKGLVMGKDAVRMAKAFEEEHQWAAAAGSLEQRIGLREKLSYGGAAVRGVDGRFQVSRKARTAIAATAAVFMSTPFLSTGLSCISTALAPVSRAAGDVAAMTLAKAGEAELDKTEATYRERTEYVHNFAQLHLDDDSFEQDGPHMAPI